MNRLLKRSLVLILLLAGHTASAQGDCSVATAYKSVESIVSAAQIGVAIIADGLNAECYFGESDQTAWVKDARQKLSRDEFDRLTDVQRVKNLQAAIQVTRRSLELEPGEIPYRDIYLSDLQTWQVELEDIPEGQPATYLEPVNYFTISQNGLQFGTIFDFNSLLQTVCSANAWQRDKEPCLGTVGSIETSLRYFEAMKAINAYAGLGDMRDVLHGITELDQRWTAYFEEARSQNILELLWNSHRSPKNPDGFAPVPNSQIILLHPSIAMEYVEDTSDGDQFKETLIVEVLGINRWSWGGGKMKRPIGVSVIAAYSDRPDVDDLGWGLMAHFNHKFSFGVTKRGGDTGFFLSLDLQQFYTKWTDDKKEEFAGYKELSDLKFGK